MIVVKYSHVLSAIRPNSEWKMINEDYSTLEWFSSDPKPSKEFLDSEIERMISERKILLCKSNVQNLLIDSDWIDLYSNRNKIENINEWDQYRLKLQKIRINPVENPTFPDKPKVIWKDEIL